MADITIQGRVGQSSPRAEADGIKADIKLNRRGEVCVVDFYTQMALEGRAFQIRMGTITVPAVGDVVITDTKAEMCVDAVTGTTVLPVHCHIAVRLGTGTLHEYAVKSVAAVSTSGTAFVPLPLFIGGRASTCACRAAEAGGVVTIAELVTTTRCHWHVANPLAVAAGHSFTTHVWEPRTPPPVVGPANAYVQVAATGTGPSYYSAFEYIELPTTSVS